MIKKFTRKNNQVGFKYARRSVLLAAGFVFLCTLAGPIFLPSKAAAYGLVSSRSIALTSGSSAASTTANTYTVTYTPATTATSIKTIIINFCQNDPIIDDICYNNQGATSYASSGGGTGEDPWITGVGSFNISYTGCVANACSWSASTAYPSGGGAPTGCVNTAGTGGSTYAAEPNTLYITNASAQSMSGTGAITITIPSVDNPTSIEPFYARIETFSINAQSNATASNNYCPEGNNSTTNVIDAGGTVNTTVQQINIQSKVQEQLFFCMYIAATPAAMDTTAYNCTAVSGSQVCLGSGESAVTGFGGPCTNKDTLSTSANYVDTTTKFDLTSNAYHGVKMYLYTNGTNPTLYNASSTHNIESSANSGTGSTAGTAYAVSTYGSEQFGMCAWQTGNAGGASMTIQAPYNSSSNGDCTSNATQTTGVTEGSDTDNAATFGLDIANAEAGTSEIAATPTTNGGGADGGEIVFAANISPTTPAGIYTTTLTFIANATY